MNSADDYSLRNTDKAGRVGSVAGYVPFTIAWTFKYLTVGTTYCFDAALVSDGTYTASLKGVNFVANERPL